MTLSTTPKTRDEWIAQCAERFARAGCSAFSSRDLAIGEFDFRCREEPLGSAPATPADRWPDPVDAADDAMREWDNDGEEA